MAEHTDAELLTSALAILHITREQLEHLQGCDECRIDMGDESYGYGAGWWPGCGPELHKASPDRYDAEGKWIGPKRSVGVATEAANPGDIVGVLLYPNIFPKVPVARQALSFQFEKDEGEG